MFELTPRQMRTVAAAVTTVAAVIIVIAAGLLGWLIVLFVRTFSGVFLPLVVGAVAALVFRPYYDWLRGPGRMPAAAAVAAVFLSALVPLAAFIAFFGSLAVRQLLGLAEQAPELWEKTRTLVEAMLPRVGVVLDTWGVSELLREILQEIVSAQQTTVVEWLRIIGSQAVAAGFGFARGFSALLSWAITPIYFAYFMTATGIRFDADRLLPFLTPGTRRDVTYLVHEFVDILVAFLRGQLIIASLQGLLFAVGFSLIGLSYGFVIGMALGMLNIVPYLGSMIGLAVALPIAFFQEDGGLSTCVSLLVVFAVVQQIEGWFLTPRIMGKRTGLHFMAIVVAILFWGTVFDSVLGLVLAIPLTAFLESVWHLAREKYFPVP